MNGRDSTIRNIQMREFLICCMRRRMSASDAPEAAAEAAFVPPFAVLAPALAGDCCNAASGCRASLRGESSSTLNSMPLEASPAIEHIK